MRFVLPFLVPLCVNAVLSKRVCDEIAPGVCGPQILIGGAMKCGTNTIAMLLARHPMIKLKTCDKSKNAECNDQLAQAETMDGNIISIWESHFFTYNYQRKDWFLNLIPRTDGFNNITFEKSPSYLDTQIHPDVIQRVSKLLPNSKIIFTVCNPTERLMSEYNHVMKWEPEMITLKYTENNWKPPDNFSDFISSIQEGSEFCQRKLNAGNTAKNQNALS